MDIVLVGGLWLDGSAWYRTASALEGQGHRAVALTLPGQGDGNSSATLDDQLAAVLAAVDACPGRPMVVGHSAACTLAWLAADRRPERVARVALVGGFPTTDGRPYADFFPITDGAMPFPGWGPFEGADSADLDDAARAAFTASAVPVPEGVARAAVHFTDERRRAVPAVVVCPEFTPAQARAWVADGDVPELADAADVTYVDIDSGHWPMLTRPAALAGVLATAASA
jgi:pimeloyl-ACP methyl ester carboxylesterase